MDTILTLQVQRSRAGKISQVVGTESSNFIGAEIYVQTWTVQCLFNVQR